MAAQSGEVDSFGAEFNSSFIDLKLTQSRTMGRDEALAAGVVGLIDAEFNDDSESLHTMAAPMNFRNYFDDFTDISPSGAPAQFGRPVNFKFTSEGPALVGRVELVTVFAPIVNETTQALAIAGNTGYQAEWIPYLGEAILGEEYRLKYNSNILRAASASQIHFQKRLEARRADANDDAYRRGVRDFTSQVSSEREVITVTELSLPWGQTDRDMLISSGLPTEVLLNIRIPTAISLQRRRLDNAMVQVGSQEKTDLKMYSGAGLDTLLKIAPWQPYPDVKIVDMYLRVHHTSLERVERAVFTELCLLPGGVTYQILDNEDIEGGRIDYADTAVASDTKQLNIDLQVIKNPVSYISAVVRLLKDVQQAEAIIHGDDTPFFENDAGIFADLAALNPSPDWTAAIPISSWTIMDGGQRLTPVFTAYYWGQIYMAQFFTGDLALNQGVVPFNRSPLQPHGVGHVTLSNLNKPTMRIEVEKWFNKRDQLKDLNLQAHHNGDDWFYRNAPRALGTSRIEMVGLDVNEALAGDVFAKDVAVFARVRNKLRNERGELLRMYA
jgi:hypothetical protein